DPALGTTPRVWHRADDPRELARGPASGYRFAVSCPSPTGEERRDCGRVGHIREPPACSRLSAHCRRTKAARRRTLALGAAVRGHGGNPRATSTGDRSMIAPWRRHRRDLELDEELAGHMRMAIEERVARGERREDAERAARREFGNLGVVKEVTREMWGGGWL